MIDLKMKICDVPTEVTEFARGPGVPASVQTTGNVFPMNLNGNTIVLKISSDGGTTYPTTRTHTFAAANPYNSIADVVADVIADATFLGGGSVDIQVFAVGSELLIRTKAVGQKALKIDATSTGIGAGKLQFASNQVGNGTVSTIISIVPDASGKYVIFFT